MSPLPLEQEVSSNIPQPDSLLLYSNLSFSHAWLGINDDYEAVSATLTLEAGSNPRTCVNVIINDDAFDEIDTEIFIIDLTLLSPGPVFRDTTDVFIEDDGEFGVVVRD